MGARKKKEDKSFTNHLGLKLQSRKEQRKQKRSKGQNHGSQGKVGGLNKKAITIVKSALNSTKSGQKKKKGKLNKQMKADGSQKSQQENGGFQISSSNTDRMAQLQEFINQEVGKKEKPSKKAPVSSNPPLENDKKGNLIKDKQKLTSLRIDQENDTKQINKYASLLKLRRDQKAKLYPVFADDFGDILADIEEGSMNRSKGYMDRNGFKKSVLCDSNSDSEDSDSESSGSHGENLSTHGSSISNGRMQYPSRDDDDEDASDPGLFDSVSGGHKQGSDTYEFEENSEDGVNHEFMDYGDEESSEDGNEGDDSDGDENDGDNLMDSGDDGSEDGDGNDGDNVMDSGDDRSEDGDDDDDEGDEMDSDAEEYSDEEKRDRGGGFFDCEAMEDSVEESSDEDPVHDDTKEYELAFEGGGNYSKPEYLNNGMLNDIDNYSSNSDDDTDLENFVVDDDQVEYDESSDHELPSDSEIGDFRSPQRMKKKRRRVISEGSDAALSIEEVDQRRLNDTNSEKESNFGSPQKGMLGKLRILSDSEKESNCSSPRKRKRKRCKPIVDDEDPSFEAEGQLELDPELQKESDNDNSVIDVNGSVNDSNNSLSPQKTKKKKNLQAIENEVEDVADAKIKEKKKKYQVIVNEEWLEDVTYVKIKKKKIKVGGNINERGDNPNCELGMTEQLSKKQLTKKKKKLLCEIKVEESEEEAKFSSFSESDGNSQDFPNGNHQDTPAAITEDINGGLKDKKKKRKVGGNINERGDIPNCELGMTEQLSKKKLKKKKKKQVLVCETKVEESEEEAKFSSFSESDGNSQDFPNGNHQDTPDAITEDINGGLIDKQKKKKRKLGGNINDKGDIPNSELGMIEQLSKKKLKKKKKKQVALCETKVEESEEEAKFSSFSESDGNSQDSPNGDHQDTPDAITEDINGGLKAKKKKKEKKLGGNINEKGDIPNCELGMTEQLSKKKLKKKKQACETKVEENEEEARFSSFSETDGNSQDSPNGDHQDTSDAITEDIYGRLRDKKGNVISDREAVVSGKYIPPALRKLMAMSVSEKKKEQLAMLKRNLKGLLNRLAESNIAGIASQIEGLYHKHSQNDMSDCLSQLLFESLVLPSLTPERLVEEHALLIAVLSANVGNQVGAHILTDFVVKLHDKMQEKTAELDCKRYDNMLLVVANLFNFRVVSARLIYDILQRLADVFMEKEVELILMVLRTVGFSLRKEDPLALKTFITQIQSQAAQHQAKGSTNYTRICFMLEIIHSIKNNNPSKVPNYDPSHVEHLKKVIKGLIHKGKNVSPLYVTLTDIVNSQSQGRWWIVGSAWSGGLKENESPLELEAFEPRKTKCMEDEFSDHFRKKAAKLQLTRPPRINIMYVITEGSEDYLDAFDKLLQLKLPANQEQEMFNVILLCVQKGKEYNEFYSYLTCRMCKFNKKYKRLLQFAVWDKFEEIENYKPRDVENLAKFLVHVIGEDGLYITVLKTLSFIDAEAQMVDFVKIILKGLLLNPGGSERVLQIFGKISGQPDLQFFCQSLRVFIAKFLISKKKKDKPKYQVLYNRSQEVLELLSTRGGVLL